MEKIKSIRLYDQVADMIKKMILSGKYHKGDLLPTEKKLIELTGVSRITVREALRILKEVGIIERVKGKGSIVLLDAYDLIENTKDNPHYRKYRNNFDMAINSKLLIEPEVAKKACLLATEEDIEILDKLTSSTDLHENILSKQLNDFHYQVATILKNDLILKFYEEIDELSSDEFPSALIPPGKQESIIKTLNEQHRKIFEAIKSKNQEFAYFYMKEHILYTKGLYENYFNEYYN